MHLHLEWGEQAIRANPQADLYVIVDVMSFSTCVDIAVSRGATILPFRYRDGRAADYAASHAALLAADRDQRGFSLSPASLRPLPAGTRLVLPSPNGATLSLATGDTPTLCACLRNARAVAEWIMAQGFATVQLVAAGERWPDGSLRPAIEDWLGAGAVLAGLNTPKSQFSPEAALARDSFLSRQDSLAPTLNDCLSGQELIGRGFAEDVVLASEIDVSRAIPGLRNEAYSDWGTHA